MNVDVEGVRTLKTILVVDDEPELLDIVIDVLSDPGWIVIGAADAYEALRILAERPVDLLITDVRMPGLNGFQLARQAKLMRADLHVIYISGYYGRTDQSGGPVFGRLLRKPFRTAELLREIEHQLGGPTCG